MLPIRTPRGGLSAALLLGAFGAGMAACGGGGFGPAPPDAASDTTPTPDATPGDAGTDTAEAGPTRAFAMAAGGVQMLVTPRVGLAITPANLADDVDVIEVHQEFYGVPWDEFATGAPPPAAWKAVMDGIVSAVGQKPVFLSVSMLNGERDSLGAKTVIVGGNVTAQDHWAAPCYDFATAADAATWKQAYLAYVRFMIDEFSPRWLNIAVEVNLFFEKCPGAVAGVVDVANAAYDAAKAKRADLVTFPSIQIEHLYGYDSASCPNPALRDTCFNDLYAQIKPLKRDRFAISSYPMGAVTSTPASLPADWFTRGATKSGDRPLIAETGWDSTPVIVETDTGMCTTVLTSTETDTTSYLGVVLDAAKAANMDLVNWWADRDLLASKVMTDCPCMFDATWCAVVAAFRGPKPDGGLDTQFLGELSLKGFGTMGLRNYDGTPKSGVYARWLGTRAVPWAP